MAGRSTDRDAVLKRMATKIGPGALGSEIVEFLRSDRLRKQMTETAEQGLPPAGAVSHSLVERFGMAALRSHAIHRFIGAAIRTILKEDEFEPVSAGIRLNRDDPLFLTATTFKRHASSVDAGADDILARFVDSLTPPELDRLRYHLDKNRKDRSS